MNDGNHQSSLEIQPGRQFHKHKVGNNGINANVVFPYSCNFLHYLDLKMLVNVKLDVIW